MKPHTCYETIANLGADRDGFMATFAQLNILIGLIYNFKKRDKSNYPGFIRF